MQMNFRDKSEKSQTEINYLYRDNVNKVSTRATIEMAQPILVMSFSAYSSVASNYK